MVSALKRSPAARVMPSKRAITSMIAGPRRPGRPRGGGGRLGRAVDGDAVGDVGDSGRDGVLEHDGGGGGIAAVAVIDGVANGIAGRGLCFVRALGQAYRGGPDRG